jgi:asparagine synthase (glutamine-hydrolysing)
MSAIAGWLRHPGDPRDGTAVVQRMLDAMRERGPDGATVHSYPGAVLGYRQPGMASAGLVCSGELDNTAALTAALGGPAGSPADLLSRGYRAWGEGLADRIEGRYAFVAYDPNTGEALLVRDRLGCRPLYYQPIEDGLLFASTPAAILASGLVEPAVGLDGLRELLGFTRTPGLAIPHGMHEVAPGHLVRVHDGQPKPQAYWRLTAQEHREDPEATRVRVRELLEAAVAGQLRDREAPTALLSGLDSSAVTALAQQWVRERDGQPMRSLSVRFTLPGAPAPNGSFLTQLAGHLGTEHREVPVNALRLTLPATRTATMRARGLPPVGEFDTSLYLIFQAVGQRTRVALSGDGADELFGGYYWCHDPVAVHAGTFPWVDVLASYDRFAALLDPDLAGALDLRGYRAHRYAEALAEVPRLAGEPAPERRMREIGYLNLTRFFPMVLDRTDAMSAAAGVTVRAPFTDRHLTQYAFNVPWSVKALAGQPKSLLRAATRDLLPADLPASDHRPAPNAGNLPYHRLLCDAVRDLLAQRNAPVLALLDPAAVRAVLAAPPAAALLDRMEVELELILSVNAWLDHYRFRLRW